MGEWRQGKGPSSKSLRMGSQERQGSSQTLNLSPGSKKRGQGARPQPSLAKKRQGPMDRKLLIVSLALMAFGVLMVFSASSPFAFKTYHDPYHYLKKDLLYASLGAVVMLVTSLIDYRKFYRQAPVLFLISLILCLLVFTPGLGKTVNDARRWIQIKSFSFMPIDLMKVGLTFFMASWFSKMGLRERRSFKTFCLVMVLAVISIFPIMKQPNFSGAIILASLIFFMYFIGGMPIPYLILTLVLGGLGIHYGFQTGAGNYRLNRLFATLNPFKDPTGSGWQLIQSLYAVSSGGLNGVGFGQSRQKFDYLAEEPHNDFIFSVFSEEFGFIGAFFLLAVYAYIIYRAFLAGKHARTRFGRLLAHGLSFVIAFQTLVNVGVAIGLVPTTGVTLPFVSYGGSSLVIMCFMVGVILNISRDRA